MRVPVELRIFNEAALAGNEKTRRVIIGWPAFLLVLRTGRLTGTLEGPMESSGKERMFRFTGSLELDTVEVQH